MNLGDEDDFIAIRTGATENQVFDSPCSGDSTAVINHPGKKENCTATATFSIADLYGLPELIAQKVGGSSGQETVKILGHLRSALLRKYPDNSSSRGSVSGTDSLQMFDTGRIRASEPWWAHEDENTLRRWSECEFSSAHFSIHRFCHVAHSRLLTLESYV